VRVLLDENFPLQRTSALEAFLVARPAGLLFEILPDGELVAWEESP
jgi:hypothetical protein